MKLTSYWITEWKKKNKKEEMDNIKHKQNRN